MARVLPIAVPLLATLAFGIAAAPSQSAEPLARLRVLVLRADGTPWPGQEVSLRWQLHGVERELAAWSDLFGSLEVELPATLPDLHVAWGDGVGTAREAATFSLALRAWATTELLLAPRPAGSFVASLFDAQGQPVAGAEVYAGAGSEPPLARSDETGRFRLDGLAGADRILLALPSGARATLAGEAAAGANVIRSFRLPPARALEVRVRDLEGAVLAGALVTAGADYRAPQPGDRAYFAAATAPCDAGGVARFAEVPAFALPLRVELPGYQTWSGRVPDQDGYFELALAPAWTIAGEVLDASGDGVAGAIVVARVTDRELPELREAAALAVGATRSDESGRFLLRLAGAGRRAALVVQAPGHALAAWWPIELAPRTGPLQLRLEPEAPLAGVALEADGRPLLEAALELERLAPPPTWEALFGGAVPHAGEDGLHWEAALPIAEDGRFCAPSLPPGLYRLTLRSTRDGRILARTVRGTGDERLRLERGEGAAQLLALEFRALDRDGVRPLVDFEIHLTSGSRTRTRRVLSTSGRYLWDGLESGDYRIELRAAGRSAFAAPQRSYPPGRAEIAAILPPPPEPARELR